MLITTSHIISGVAVTMQSDTEKFSVGRMIVGSGEKAHIMKMSDFYTELGVHVATFNEAKES